MFVDDEEMSGIHEALKVFPSAVKKKPRVIPGYEEMMEGLEKDKEGKHEEAFKLYERAGRLGNKGGFMNMGNCYLFGVGVECDVMKGLSWWMNGGHVEDENIGLYKLLSNFQYMGRSEIDLSGLFLL